MTVSAQLMDEVNRRKEEIDEIDYGEIIFRVHNKKIELWDVRKTFKVGAVPKNGRLREKT